MIGPSFFTGDDREPRIIHTSHPPYIDEVDEIINIYSDLDFDRILAYKPLPHIENYQYEDEDEDEDEDDNDDCMIHYHGVTGESEYYNIEYEDEDEDEENEEDEEEADEN